VVRPEIGIAKVYETELGLLIYKLVPGGPAERAGLRGPAVVTRRKGPFVIESMDRSAADLIIGVDDQKVTNADDFLTYIESKTPGQNVTVKVIRQNQETRIPVQLGSGS
jgi:S1-C subfamily serine protease